VDKLEERMVLQEAGRRLFHREGPITLKDLDLTIVVLAQGTIYCRRYPQFCATCLHLL